jgi:predicted glycosyltransferase
MVSLTTLHLFPDAILSAPHLKPGINPQRLCGYSIHKEDLYVYDSVPDPSYLAENRVSPRKVITILKRPAAMAHHAVPESEISFNRALDLLCEQQKVQVLLALRTPRQQEESMSSDRKRGLVSLYVLDYVHDGPSMMKSADSIVCCCGTMIGQEVTIGMPACSIYHGSIGVGHRRLTDTGRLKRPSMVDRREKIPLTKMEERPADHRGGATERVGRLMVQRIIESAGKAVR